MKHDSPLPNSLSTSLPTTSRTRRLDYVYHPDTKAKNASHTCSQIACSWSRRAEKILGTSLFGFEIWITTTLISFIAETLELGEAYSARVDEYVLAFSSFESTFRYLQIYQ
jgi:hypothetical protein